METGEMMQPMLVIAWDFPKSRMGNTNEISAMELQRNAGIVHESVLLGVVSS